MKELMQEIENEYGTIQSVSSAGNLPFPDFFAMSLLMFEMENGSAGIPIIWEDQEEILGFRPMLVIIRFHYLE